MYANADLERRKENWNELYDIGRGRMVAWACMGDFNAIRHHYGKEGGQRKSQRQMDELYEMIESIHINR